MTMTEGALVTIDGKAAIRFERRYRHPIDRVWRAVTDPAEMRQWFPSNVDGDRAVGGELLFLDDAQRAAAHEEGRPTRVNDDVVRGQVLVHDPPKVFSFTWGTELLRFELLPDGDATTLVFTHILSHPSVAFRNGSGWHMCIAALDRLLGLDVPDTDWQTALGDYLDRMGPPLGVPAADGSMTWERTTHVDADRVRAVATDADELAKWGAGERAEHDDCTWDIHPLPIGTEYRLTVAGAAKDPEVAAAWHALLVQLDIYLAAGQLVPVSPDRWTDAYHSRL